MPKSWRTGARQRGRVAATDLTAGPTYVAPCEPVLVRAPHGPSSEPLTRGDMTAASIRWGVARRPHLTRRRQSPELCGGRDYAERYPVRAGFPPVPAVSAPHHLIEPLLATHCLP
jgi:hypothetical protein